MGWNLRGSDDGRIMAEINITPLTDVMLVLLVIFMVTTPLIIMDSLKVKLPKAVTADAEPGTGVVVAVSRDGRIEVNGRAAKLAGLAALLRGELARSKVKTVLVRADGDTRHGVVVGVLDAARRAGADKLSIATEKEEE